MTFWVLIALAVIAISWVVMFRNRGLQRVFETVSASQPAEDLPDGSTQRCGFRILAPGKFTASVGAGVLSVSPEVIQLSVLGQAYATFDRAATDLTLRARVLLGPEIELSDGTQLARVVPDDLSRTRSALTLHGWDMKP